jgi:hypothetical protein
MSGVIASSTTRVWSMLGAMIVLTSPFRFTGRHHRTLAGLCPA